MQIDLVSELKCVILNTTSLKNTFTKNHPNTKYSLDLIINELLYFLKSGVSWRHLRSPINYKTSLLALSLDLLKQMFLLTYFKK